MRIVVCSDLHLDWVSSGVSRFDEVAAAVDRIVDVAIEREADAWLFAGDAMNPDSGSCVFRCLDVLVRATGRCHRNGIRSILIAGNHDTIEDGRSDTTLSPLRSLPGVDVLESPRLIVLTDKNGLEVQLLGLPYVSTSNDYSPAAVIDRECGGIGPLLVVEHLNVRGIVPGSETDDMPRGRSVWFPDEEVMDVARRRPTTVIGGHFHRAQRHTCPSGLEVRIVGSVCVLTHGEEANSPSFLVVDL